MADSIIKAMQEAGQRNANSASKVYSPSEITSALNDVPNASFTDGGLAFMRNNADSYINAVNQQALWNREDKLRLDAEKREDYSMDRLIEAAKRNGINPIFLLDAFNSQTGNAASYSTSAAKANNYDTNARTDAANSAKVAGSIIAAMALIAAALLG